MASSEEALNDHRNEPPRKDLAEGSAPQAPRRRAYEPPRIVRVENVHDLVAGGVGSRPDQRARAQFS